MTYSLPFLLALALTSFSFSFGDEVSWKSENPRIQRLIDLGNKHESEGDLTNALQQYKAILEIDPKEKRALATIGGLYGMLGKYQEEIEWSKKSIDVDPNFWMPYLNRGSAQLNLKHPNQARADFQRAIALHPESPLPYFSMGDLEELLGNYKEALGWYKKTIQKDPNFEAGYFNMAAMQANLGLFEEAKSNLKIVLQLNPKAQDAKEMLNRMAKDPRLTKDKHRPQ